MSKSDIAFICVLAMFGVTGSVGGIAYLMDKHFPMDEVEQVKEECADIS